MAAQWIFLTTTEETEFVDNREEMLHESISQPAAGGYKAKINNPNEVFEEDLHVWQNIYLVIEKLAWQYCCDPDTAEPQNANSDSEVKSANTVFIVRRGWHKGNQSTQAEGQNPEAKARSKTRKLVKTHKRLTENTRTNTRTLTQGTRRTGNKGERTYRLNALRKGRQWEAGQVITRGKHTRAGRWTWNEPKRKYLKIKQEAWDMKHTENRKQM